MRSRLSVLCATAVFAAGCTGEAAGPDAANGVVAGAPLSAATRALDMGAAVLQDKPPIDALNAYLNGFHFYNGDMNAQMEAHHYCSHLNEEVIQCVIYDGSTRSARLMGLEYIISARLFAQLPLAEKSLWHSHVHEVKSGQLVAPGIPEVVERQLMKRIVTTYGKTWHTWHASHGDSGSALPLGVPQLMMGFTADGQVDAAMVEQRDARLGVHAPVRRERRQSLPSPTVDPAADAWQQGHSFQLHGPDDRHGQHPPAGR